MQQEINDPKTALNMSRLIWGALLLGCIVAAVVIVAVHEPAEIKRGVDAVEQSQKDLLSYLPIAFIIIATPISLFIRSQIFKQGWVQDSVKPQSYLTGTIASLAIVESAVIFGLVFIFVVDAVYPTILGPGLGIVILCLLFPNGKALTPTPNPYARKPDGLN